jgi:hypothetical protein
MRCATAAASPPADVAEASTPALCSRLHHCWSCSTFDDTLLHRDLLSRLLRFDARTFYRCAHARSAMRLRWLRVKERARLPVRRSRACIISLQRDAVQLLSMISTHHLSSHVRCTSARTSIGRRWCDLKSCFRAQMCMIHCNDRSFPISILCCYRAAYAVPCSHPSSLFSTPPLLRCSPMCFVFPPFATPLRSPSFQSVSLWCRLGCSRVYRVLLVLVVVEVLHVATDVVAIERGERVELLS